MFSGVYRHLDRNFWRKNLPVFDCPHCGVLCQETAWTYYAFVVLCAGSVFGLMVLSRTDLFKDLNGLWIFSGIYFLASYAWWKGVAVLKEPYHFFWE
jgi:hypothetical protein